MNDLSITTLREARAAGLTVYFNGKSCPYGHVGIRYVNGRRCRDCRKGDRVSDGVTYFTGRPCKHGHIANRYSKGGNCTVCVQIKTDKRRAANPEWKKETDRSYYWRHPERSKARSHKRNAQKRGSPASFTAEDIKEICAAQRGKCANPTCGKKLGTKFHADHIMPIALGGSNERKNIQALCAWCNRSKGALHPIVWAQKNGRLL